MEACTCEFDCRGTYKHCPSANVVKTSYFQWEGDYDRDAKVDDVTVNIGLNDILSISQPGDEPGTEDLVLVFGRERIRHFRQVLEEAEKILDARPQ